MREQLLLVLMVSGAAACAGRTAPTTLNHSGVLMTSTYACGDSARTVRREAGNVFGAGDTRLALAFQDDAGDHFVDWPTSPTAMKAVEYVMPGDNRADAIERTYDTSRGQSRADWRVVDEKVCVVKGGYSDAFFRFSNGATFEEVASELGLNGRIEARKMVKEGLRAAQESVRAASVRYHKEF